MNNLKEEYKSLDDKHKKIKLIIKDNSNEYKNILLSHVNIKLTYNSNAIEGNTLSEVETAIIIDKNEAIGGKSLREHFEAINHYNAFKYVFDRSLSKEPINQKDILHIHSIVLNNIDDINKGRYRNLGVRILGSNTIFPNYVKVPTLMNDLESLIKDVSGKDNMHPIDFAKDIHYKFVKIHPFSDGNGRTARLIMNCILMQKDYLPIIIENKNRKDYINALENKETDSSLWDNFIINTTKQSYDYFDSLFNDLIKDKSKDKKKDEELMV